MIHPVRIFLRALAACVAMSLCLASAAMADTAPSVTIEAPYNFTPTSAKLKGTVNPENGPSATEWHFEYSTDQSSWSAVEPDQVIPGSDAELHLVFSTLPGLQVGTEYFVRLVATNAGGTTISSVRHFTIRGPAWRIDSLANSTVAPGGELEYVVQTTNVGDASTDGSKIEVRATLPAGMTVVSATLVYNAATYSCFDGSDGVSPVAGASSVVCSDSLTVPSSGTDRLQKLNLRASVAGGASGTLTTAFSVSGGGAAAQANTVDPTEVTSAPPAFGIDAFDTEILDGGGEVSTAAGAHPAADRTVFLFDTITDAAKPLRSTAYPVEAVRNAGATLPPGLLGNPTEAPTCTLVDLAHSEVLESRPLCEPDTQVGSATVFSNAVTTNGVQGNNLVGPLPLFNLVTPPGVAARFGFDVLGTPIVVDATVHPSDGYRVTVAGTNIPQAIAVVGNELTFWGDPADPVHKPERSCKDRPPPVLGGGTCDGAPEPVAFLRNPTSCTPASQGLATDFHATSWLGSEDSASSTSHEAPGFPHLPSEWGPTVGIEGCEAVPFSPTLAAAPPAGTQAGQPTGLSVDLTMPQQGLEDPAAISESDLRKAVVTLPQGVRLNPSAADGLGACSPAQVGLTSPVGQADARFDDAPATCPDNAKIGSMTIQTPLLDHPIEGSVYLAQQTQNPFGSLQALYLVADDEASGLVLKLPGEVSFDPATGQITSTFDNNPQLPFTSLHLELRTGPRAPLAAPRACGTYTTHAVLTGWSGRTVTSDSDFTIEEGCDGGGFNPKLAAGTKNPLAGQASPFSLRLTREGTEQELAGLKLAMPPGLSGYLAGIPYCPDATLASISGELGTGAAQEASPSCPAASQVGTATVGAGAGPTPFFTQAGRVYLAGPYKGAPLSLAVVNPAVAGPFDLGSVVVRNAIHVDPTSAQLTVDSDPLPTILHGIPLDLRDVRVDVSRDHFILNPTSCDPMQIGSTLSSTSGATASPSVRFQVSGCDALAFKPALSLKLRGGTKRSKNPAVTAVMRPQAGNANLKRISVALPHSEFLAQGHIRTICTRVQFAADSCPAGSIYGSVMAKTPILDQPLTGSVYLRSSDHPLPDMVLKLKGPPSLPIEIDAVGRIDSIKGGIRTSFEGLPDAPLTEVVLSLPGGKKSLLENSTDICLRKKKATVQMDAQNNAVRDFRPTLQVKCPKRKGGKKKHGSRGRKR